MSWQNNSIAEDNPIFQMQPKFSEKKNTEKNISQ